MKLTPLVASAALIIAIAAEWQIIGLKDQVRTLEYQLSSVSKSVSMNADSLKTVSQASIAHSRALLSIAHSIKDIDATISNVMESQIAGFRMIKRLAGR